MSVTVLGSLNEDVLVAVRRLPGRRETVVGSAATPAPGGKGTTQTAAARLLGPGVHMVPRRRCPPPGFSSGAAGTGSA